MKNESEKALLDWNFQFGNDKIKMASFLLAQTLLDPEVTIIDRNIPDSKYEVSHTRFVIVYNFGLASFLWLSVNMIDFFGQM